MSRLDAGGGARAGIIAAAAGAGALLSFGLRQGMPARPFNAIGTLLLGERARGVWGFDLLASTAGMAIYVTFCVLAGVLLSMLVRALTRGTNGRRQGIAAFVLALAALLGMLLLLVRAAPDIVGAPPSAALTVTQGIVVTFLLSVGFGSGMRLAR